MDQLLFSSREQQHAASITKRMIWVLVGNQQLNDILNDLTAVVEVLEDLFPRTKPVGQLPGELAAQEAESLQTEDENVSSVLHRIGADEGKYIVCMKSPLMGRSQTRQKLTMRIILTINPALSSMVRKPGGLVKVPTVLAGNEGSLKVCQRPICPIHTAVVASLGANKAKPVVERMES